MGRSIRDKFYLRFLIISGLFFIFLLNTQSSIAAHVIASTATITSPFNGANQRNPLCIFPACYSNPVINPSYAAAENNNAATLFASPGIAAGVDSYYGELQLRFGAVVPSNTWSYVRIAGDADLFEALLGGSLGNLLGNVLGTVLLGRQNIQIQALNGASTPVLTRTSLQGFDTDRVRMVVDKNGHYYLAIKPSQAYDRIRITNSAVAALGFGSEYTLDVYHIFYFDSPDACGGQPTFTSFDGSGATLDLLSLNSQSAGLFKAIDDDPMDTYSELSLGVVGLAGTSEQMVYFNTPVQPGNDILVSIAKDGSLVDLGLLNYVELVAYSDGVQVQSRRLSDLLELDLLGLFSSEQYFQFPISDDLNSIDRIGIRISSLLSVGVLEGKLLVNAVTVSPSSPVVDSLPEEGAYVICEGNSLTITPQYQAGRVLNWYSDWEGADFIGEADSYTIPDDLEPGEHDFFIRAATSGCSGESLPSVFKVLVEPLPVSDSINIQPHGGIGIDENGKYVYVEGLNPVSLDPALADESREGDFSWFFDPEMNDTIHHGLLRDEVMYEITPEGELTMTGLKFRDELDPYHFYVNWAPEEGCPPSSAKEINLSSIARILSGTLSDFSVEKTLIKQIAIDWRFTNLGADETVRLSRAGGDLVFSEIAEFPAADGLDQRFLDTSPLVGYNYYRLEIVGEDLGVRFTSAVEAAHFTFEEESLFGVFPNQFEHQISLSYHRYEIADADIFLLSGQGRLLEQRGFQFSGGQNVFTLDDLQYLAPGSYILVIATTQMKTSFQLLKK